MDEFPMTLLRSGTSMVWDGMNLDMLIVEDADALAAAQADGWLLVADVAAVVAEPASEIDAAEPAKKSKAG